ncbi:hypothetical protein LJB84_01665 [Bacteroidales bacterium OttesenSCG-928-J19]|nr:hypothetical protein [Bacteroidales bacterium OttesenSCG-928-J19]
MALTTAEKNAIISEVVNRIKADSQSVTELEVVSALTGINSLPAMQGTKLVSAPVSLLSKPATDAATAANNAATAANNAADSATLAAGTAQNAREQALEAATAANAATAAAQTIANNYESTVLAARNGASARFDSFVDDGTIELMSSASTSGKIVFVKSKGLFAYQVGSTLFSNWLGADMYLNEARTSVLPDKIYLCEDKSYIYVDGGLKQSSGSGSGSGFYNVTGTHPLASGYYTKDTAVAALADAELEDEEKAGLIITFETAAGKWVEYRYEGTNINGFLSPSAWSRYGGGDAIKKVTVTKGTQTQELTPDEQGNVNLEIPVVNVDETLDENSTNPVQNKALAAEFNKLAGKYGSALRLNEIGEGADKAYSLSLLDESGEVLNTSDMFTGGGGGTVATTKIQLTRITANPTVKSGDEVKLTYTFDHIDTESGATTGNTGHIVVTITRGASSYTFEKDLAAGSTDTIDVTKYLGVGSNSIRVRASVGEGAEQQVSQISWTVSVVQLTLTSSFNYAAVINRGDTISV